jgi:flagella basal body P-ring formation protein FlgA
MPLGTNQMRGGSVRSIPVVHAGDIVRLWKQEDILRIEVAGVSEESGGLGKTIRVRLLRQNTDSQVIPEQFFGIVRGPSDVEMQP